MGRKFIKKIWLLLKIVKENTTIKVSDDVLFFIYYY